MRPRRWLLLLTPLLLLGLNLAQARVGAERWEQGQVLPLAEGVAALAREGVNAGDFHTGSARFDGEWALVTCQMAVLGLGQVSRAHPERAPELLPAIRACTDSLLAPEMRAFGTAAWGQDGLSASQGHTYLGYVALALGMSRRVDPDFQHAALHDALIASLRARLLADPLLPTYPGEIYPADISSVLGAVGLHQQVTGAAPDPAWQAAHRDFERRFVDPDSGLLVQSVTASGQVLDGPRSSGTGIAAYFLSFSDPALASRLYGSLTDCCMTRVAGLGLVMEYPPGVSGRGDIDSGPVIFGVGMSSTGFAIAGARGTHDSDGLRALWSTARFFGVPVRWGGRQRFAAGMDLGNAILLAGGTSEPWR